MIGRTLSHYKIVALLGRGGMGEVYVAEDLRLKRRVAIKILPTDVATDETLLARFEREAEAVAAINHPGIVTIHSLEQHEDQRFIAMELVDGESLDRRIARGTLSLAEIFDIAIPLADALVAAHARGVVHRDLKPANIMVTREGRVKVLDFGLAKLVDASSDLADSATATMAAPPRDLTLEGTVIGTAGYISPEQLGGKPVDSRTDVFAFGVVLFELATGMRPFTGSSAAEVASSILRDPPPPVTERNATLPQNLVRIIHRCLEKDRERRFQSVLDVRNQLEELRREIDSGEVAAGVAEPAPTPQPAAEGAIAGTGTRPAARWPLVAVALLVIGALAFWWTGRGAAPVEDRGAVPAAQPRSVAVLPFEDLSPDRDQEHFTDGITEEIIQALARIDGLDVPSRSASFALKGRRVDPREVAEALSVEALVEGSVRKAGEKLRISAQLVQASNGFALWSQTYDRRLEDVFALQDEIARSIAAALELTLTPAASSIVQAETTSVEAYDYYLRGQEFYKKQTREGFEFACQMFQRAVEIDPTYALAYNGLAGCHGVLYDVYGMGEEHLQEVDRTSRIALELAPDLAESHMARGEYFALVEALDDAEREYRRALAIDPGLAKAHFAYGNVLFKHGRLEETANLWERASELDPNDLRPIRVLPQVYRSLGWQEQFESANLRRVEASKRRLRLNPDDQASRLAGAISLLALGQEEEAFEWAGRVLESATEDALILYNTGCFYSRAGRVDEAITALERAYEEGDREADWWRQDSDLDPVREDPRFEALLAKMETGP